MPKSQCRLHGAAPGLARALLRARSITAPAGKHWPGVPGLLPCAAPHACIRPMYLARGESGVACATELAGASPELATQLRRGVRRTLRLSNGGRSSCLCAFEVGDKPGEPMLNELPIIYEARLVAQVVEDAWYWGAVSA